MEIVEENELTVLLDGVQLSEGDSIQHCSDTATYILAVNSAIPWTIASVGDWFTAEKADDAHVKIVFSENITGSERSGSIAVRDTQEHEVSLVVYQTETCTTIGVEVATAQWFNVWPNPARDLVRIRIDQEVRVDEEVSIELWTADGKLLQEQKQTDPATNVIELDVSAVSPGSYLLRISGTSKPSFSVPLIKY